MLKGGMSNKLQHLVRRVILGSLAALGTTPSDVTGRASVSSPTPERLGPELNSAAGSDRKPKLILKHVARRDAWIFAAHRSHRSHQSHYSHRSHYSGSGGGTSAPRSTAPSLPLTPAPTYSLGE